jgi:transposase
MTGHLLMSKKERDRKVIFEAIKSKRLTIKEAANQLKISYRQCRRCYKRYREEGDKGLVHRLRGASSNHVKADNFHHEVLNYYRAKLEGFGPTLAAEKLKESGYQVDHETLRRWLLEAKLWYRQRQSKAYRRYRQRRTRFGELVQMDGSHHVWFGEDQNCLMNMVDDATTTTFARLFSEETTEAAMRTLWGWIENYGIPLSLYVDRKTVYITGREATIKEQLAGEEPLTAFGKACKKLKINLIAANSPQAKGRVERSHGVYQDRFVKELRLQNKQTLEEANAVLTQGFCDDLNQRFAVKAARNKNAHRPLTADINLADIFCYEETRTLQLDWTLCYQNQWFQICKTNRIQVRPKDKITVRTWLDGSQYLLFKDQQLGFYKITKPEKLIMPIILKNNTPKVHKPPMEHPYKRLSFERMKQKKLRQGTFLSS